MYMVAYSQVEEMYTRFHAPLITEYLTSYSERSYKLNDIEKKKKKLVEDYVLN